MRRWSSVGREEREVVGAAVTGRAEAKLWRRSGAGARSALAGQGARVVASMAAGYRARTGGSTATVCMAWVVVRTSAVAILYLCSSFAWGAWGGTAVG